MTDSARARKPKGTVLAGDSMLQALATLPTDHTGATTFARYRWQTKLAVYHWLTCLGGGDAPEAVICEHVEDIVVVRQSGPRFAQLKTRDKGSWSASAICDAGHGIDSLVRSYNAARDCGIHERAYFELWLEGPMGDKRETVRFFENPPAASETIRNKIVALGLLRAHLSDFLGRLVLRPLQPSRAHIDAVASQLIGCLWPALSAPEREQIYQRLLDAAEAAQACETSPGGLTTMCRRLLAGEPLEDEPYEHESFERQILSRELLRSLVPPLRVDMPEVVLDRISRGESSSALELKLRAAGASEWAVGRAKQLRAAAEVVRQTLIASRVDVDADLDGLGQRVLVLAEAAAQQVTLQTAANPGAAAKPGEFTVQQLLGGPSELAAVDHQRLFGGDGYKVFGFLCHLSDACKFWWRPQ